LATLARGQSAHFRDGSVDALSGDATAGPPSCNEPWLLAGGLLDPSTLKLGGIPAEISMDDIRLGPTPAVLLLAPGRHHLEYLRDGVRESRFIDIGPGEQSLKIEHVDLAARARVIGAEMPAHGDDVRTCYERGLKRDPTLAGAPHLRLHVLADGRVRRAEIVESDLGDIGVESCITTAAQHWVFPPGAPVTFDTALELRR
jgi:hypothetical protein